VRIVVDPAVCQRHGLCSFLAPEIFNLRDDLELEYVENPNPAYWDEVEEAAQACPTQAIQLHDHDPS
jgi:ferredoxin